MKDKKGIHQEEHVSHFPMRIESQKAFQLYIVFFVQDFDAVFKPLRPAGEVFEIGWENKLTDGKFTPSLHAWLDMGGSTNPLIIGEIGLEIHLRP